MAAPLVTLLLATACQPAATSTPGAKASGTGASASASPSPTPAAKHVFVIVLENTSYQLALAQPYIASLAQQYALATNYHSVANPSLPNYLAMTSGSTWGIRDDGYHRLSPGGVGSELSDAGISWKAYMEGFTGDCFNSPYPYALKHNPYAYYGGTCPANVVPMTDLATDLNGDTPQLSWITPGLCNDGHDCGIRTADQWLSQVVPQITSSPAWRQDGVLFIAWDESSAADGRVALLVVTPSLRGQIATPLDHYSLSATISDQLGVPRLGEAQQAASLSQQLQAARAKGSPPAG
ncbi:MAG TPA: alkaline phosphatase family protein [Candidatus Dormibacteraeota bacterium]|nr:alkaline phosphatase family protein [Candidatus Dormibacteraeota bacterium]